MTDLLTWSIDLGRWSGVRVRIHFFLIFFALGRLLNAAIAPENTIVATAGWLFLLLLVLALHELGHAAMAVAQNIEVEDIRLWPLGNFVIPVGSSKGNDSISVAAAGLATSGFLAIASAIVVAMAGGVMVLSPFGSGLADSGAPWVQGTAYKQQFDALSPTWWVGWFGHLNAVVFMANLIPALPMDGGRIFRAILARTSVGITRDNPYAQWMARSWALILAIVGVVKMGSGGFGDGLTLFALAILIELIVRTESRMMEDGGFFEDGVFGYDFSEGYTSLEGSAAKVRPHRESAIKRWRRRRSDLRRQRRIAREAAEEQRMDEILEKLHTQGKGALTDEEHRFLVRVSTKLRNNRSRARD
ncbi:site-2 protease family protein [Tundrisphaera lichenicola]|uniref:site-2 protease family protein n=1 Tax=Tundrisphaera lichenicola TaxID=2029860 RepID=UPI003EB78AC9